MSKNAVCCTVIVICLFTAACFAKYSGGTGEPNAPYLIATPNDLNSIGLDSNDWDKHFKMVEDIDLADFTWTASNRIGNPDNRFSGTFDGDGHEILNFSYTSTGTNYIGIFAWVDGLNVEIKDLTLIDPNVEAGEGSCVGALVASLELGTLTNCRVLGGSVSGKELIGGIVGSNWFGHIFNCYTSCSVVGTIDTVGGLVSSNKYGGTILSCGATGSVSGDRYQVGGLLGYNNGTISNCYATGTVTGYCYVGGLVGYITGVSNIFDSYSTGNVSGDKEVGGLVGYKQDSPDTSGTVYKSFWDKDTSGQTTSAGGIGKTTAQMQDPNMFIAAGWEFVGDCDGPSDIWAEPPGGGYPILWWQLSPLPPLPAFSGGTGELSDPYRIATPNDLNRIGHNPRMMKSHFVLTNNIDLSDTEFFIIGHRGVSFSGVFDGNGRDVSNFTYSSNYLDCIGFFGYVKGAEVKNVRLIDPNIDAGTGCRVGSLVGHLRSGRISYCCAQGAEVSGEDDVGGLTGYNGGQISNCYTVAAVVGLIGVGGLVGHNQAESVIPRAEISKCCSAGNVQGSVGTGGLVGQNTYYGDIFYCYSTAGVTNTWKDSAGLAGRNGGNIEYCYATGSVSNGYDGIGGLVGKNRYVNEGTVSDSFWDTQTSGQLTSDGGTPKTTAEMQTKSTFADAGWDFVGGTANGYEDIWRMCVDGVNYPKLSWEFLEYGDLICPDGVDFIDYFVLANEWRLERLEQDYNSDGRVNFKDWAIFANNWEGSYIELPPFLACWLARSARIADIAPIGGDDFVDWQDLAIQAAHWLDEK